MPESTPSTSAPPAPPLPGVPLFDPAPALTVLLLHQLAEPNHSLTELAFFHGTTLPSLILWMTRPDIAERIDQLESAVARRQRFVAVNQLSAVTRCLATIVNDFNNNSDASRATDRGSEPGGRSVSSHSADRVDRADRTSRLRESDLARRASALLLRLARFTPGPARSMVARLSEPGVPSRAFIPPLSPPGGDAAALCGREGSLPSSSPTLDPACAPAQHDQRASQLVASALNSPALEEGATTPPLTPTPDPLDLDIIDDHGQIRFNVLAAAAETLRDFYSDRARTNPADPTAAEDVRFLDECATLAHQAHADPSHPYRTSLDLKPDPLPPPPKHTRHNGKHHHPRPLSTAHPP